MRDLTFRVTRSPPKVGVLEHERPLVVRLQLVHLLLEQLLLRPFSVIDCVRSHGQGGRQAGRQAAGGQGQAGTG